MSYTTESKKKLLYYLSLDFSSPKPIKLIQVQDKYFTIIKLSLLTTKIRSKTDTAYFGDFDSLVTRTPVGH